MRFPRYPEYKESGFELLGSIPGGWSIFAMKRFAQLAYGDALPTEARDGDGQIPVYGSNGIVGFHSSANTKSPAILIGRKGSYGALNWSTQSAFAIDTVYYIDKANCLENLRWLFWALHIADFSGYSQDTGVPGLSRTLAHNTHLPLPTHEEQTAIATFLDHETAKIDALVAEQEKLIDLLKEKRQAVISHAVTKGLDLNVPMKDSGVEWLGQVPEHWEVISLKRLWDIIDCKHVTAEFVEEGFPLASIREVQSHFVNLECAKLTTDFFYTLMIEGGRDPRPGDLIFSRNATVGEVAQVADWHPSFAMGQDVCLLRKQDPKSSTDYFQAVLKSKVAQDQLAVLMIGSTFKRINVEEIRNLTVPIPPAEEQVIIANWLKENVSGLDALLRESQHAIDLLKERRAALISAAVTGKIDVRTLHPELTEAA